MLERSVHHCLVRANEQDQDRSPRERAVPQRLEEPIETGARLIRPGELVDDEDRGIIVQRELQPRQQVIPIARREGGDGFERRQPPGRGAERLSGSVHLYVDRRALHAGNDAVRDATSLGEVLDQS